MAKNYSPAKRSRLGVAHSWVRLLILVYTASLAKRSTIRSCTEDNETDKQCLLHFNKNTVY